LSLAGRIRVDLACNVDLKLHGAATGIAGLQSAAPVQFRS
jgi:hypothetical protein